MSIPTSLRRCFGLAAAGLLLTVPASGFQQAGERVEGETLRVAVDLVNLVFTVNDEDGRFVTDLDQADFTVYEDDQQQEIRSFHTETNLPLRVSLLLDASGSILNKLRFEQQVALDFFSEILRPEMDLASLTTFDFDVNELRDFTDDAQRLAEAVADIRAGGGTELFDALYSTITGSLGRQAGRRVLIVITDGVDNSSEFSLSQAIDAAQKTDVTVYAISTNEVEARRPLSSFEGVQYGIRGISGMRTGEIRERGSPETLRLQAEGNEVLRQIAAETGGTAFFPETENLDSTLRQIQQTLRSQYVLSYVPNNLARDGTFRRIRVEVVEESYAARARSGYYAPVDEKPVDLRGDLRTAARTGFATRVERLLSQGVYVDSSDPEGWSPLMLAVQEGHGPVARALLRAGADPNAGNRDGVYPLMWAIERGHDQLVCDLMDEGADAELVRALVSEREEWAEIRLRLPGSIAECGAAMPIMERRDIDDLVAARGLRIPEVLDRRPQRPYTKIRAIQYVGDAFQEAITGFNSETGPMPPEVRRAILQDTIMAEAIQSEADAIVIIEARAIYDTFVIFAEPTQDEPEVYPTETWRGPGRYVRIKYILLADAIKYRPEPELD